MAYLVFVKILITLFSASFSSVSQANVFAWPALAVIGVAGLAGVWLMRRTGFAEAWDARISNTQRFVIPIVIGLAIASLYVIFDRLTGYSHLESLQHGGQQANISMPVALPIYLGAPIILAVLYRMVPIGLPLWLISTVLLRGHGQTILFWVLAALSSLIEPLTQDLGAAQFGTGLLIAVLARGFALNFIEAALLRKYGLLASVFMRMAFYMIWHVAYAH
jgi:hypothetical protein